MRRFLNLVCLFLALSPFLPACQNGGNPPNETTDEAFRSQEAFLPKGQSWGPSGTKVPSWAKPLTHDQLLERARTGTLVPVTSQSHMLNSAAAVMRSKENDQTIQDLLATRPDLAARLRPPAPSSSVRMRPDGNMNADLSLKNNKKVSVVLNGPSVVRAGIAASLRRYRDPNNQRGIYRAAYSHLPETCQKNMPLPSQIENASLDEIMAANQKLADCYWAQGRKFGRPNPTPPTSRPSSRAGTLGVPSDNLVTKSTGSTGAGSGDSSCPSDYHYDGLHKAVSWTSKNYDSEVKEQGHRGSCAAFGIVSALESSVARSNDQWVDLSEQSLYFHEKAIDFPDDLWDGLSTPDTLEAISESHYSIPYENVWPYNTSWDREECSSDGCEWNLEDEGDLEYYRHSCDGYSGSPCSDTTHQAELVCENNDCYWWAPKDSTDSGYSVSNGYLEISSLGSDLSFVALFVNLGYSVVMDFDDTEAFHNPSTSGFVNDQGDDTEVGGHTIYVSGWVFNEDLPDRISPGKGGGYFIMKNSWGTCWGDMGYVYASFDWVKDHMFYASAIIPQREGTNHAPTVQITSPTDNANLGMGGFNGPVELRATVSDQEDGEGCCKVSWSSNVDGALGTGNPLEYYFTQSGSRTVTATVTDSQGKTNTASVYFTMDNIPPTAQITVPSHDITIYTNETQRFRGHFTDLNQLADTPCSSLTWTSSITNTAPLHFYQVNAYPVSATPKLNQFPATGCEIKVSFATAGNRAITLTATDNQGSTATDQVNVNVLAAPSSGPPNVSINYMADSILSRSTPVSLTATVTDKDNPADPVLNYRWTVAPISSTGEVGNEIDIGTTPSVDWTPETQFPDKCSGGTSQVRIRIRATDKDGTGTDYYDVYLLHSPC